MKRAVIGAATLAVAIASLVAAREFDGTNGVGAGAEVVPLKEAKLNIEHNATDEDTGFQGFIDSEGWRRLDMRGPDGTVLWLEGRGDLGEDADVLQQLSVMLAFVLIATYALGLLFSLKTHKEFFGAVSHGEGEEGEHWPLGLALGTLAGVTVLVALVSEIFVASVEDAALALGMTDAFVGFVVVALVGAAAEMASAFSGARKNRLDLSVGIALGSSTQIALFVAPVLVLLSHVVGPTPMNLQFWPGAVVMMLIATVTAFLVTNSGRA